MTQAFWEDKHRTQSTLWLTKSTTAQILDIHGISMPKGQRVLEIGVGVGGFIREISQAGNEAVACDIAETALTPLTNEMETVHVSKLSSIEPVDLAICHLVFQHCADSAMLQIIDDVPLRPDGVFSFQFAFLDSTPSDRMLQTMRDGNLVFRPLDAVKEHLNARPSVEIVDIRGPWTFDFWSTKIGWNVVQMKKRCS